MKKVFILLLSAIIVTTFMPIQGTAQQTYPICTAAQHDQYKSIGPDGATYYRWHPQIDPKLHCAYTHEHGSDPSLALPALGSPYNISAADVNFGYIAAHHMMNENHEGFKVFVFNDRSGHIWRLSVHIGSSGLGRPCTRFHEVQIMIIDDKTWDILGNVGFMGDFGAAVYNGTGNAVLTPTACPNQAKEARDDGSTGIRQFGVYSLGEIFYAPWRLDDHRLIIPIDIHALTIWTDPPIADCKDLICDEMIMNKTPDGKPVNGANRFFQYYPGTGIKSTALISGTFYTDPFGRQLLSSSDPHAVKQYIKPNSSFALPQPQGKCIQRGIEVYYQCGGFAEGWAYANYNGVIQAPN